QVREALHVGVEPLSNLLYRRFHHYLQAQPPFGEANYSVISRMTRHGFPAANTPSGMSFVTTLPAPITDLEPTFTPGQMIAPPPTHTSEPLPMGLANSCLRRSAAFIGC